MRHEVIRLLVLCVLGLVIGGLCAFYFVWSNSAEKSTPNTEATKSSAITTDITNENISSTDFPSLDEHTFTRRKVIHSFVGDLTEQEIVLILNSNASEYKDLDAREHQGLIELQRSLLERLSQTNPGEALTFALDNDLPRKFIELPAVRSIYDDSSFAPPPASIAQVSFIETVFNVWAANDLSAALDKATSLDGASRELALAGILKTQSKASLEELKQIGMQFGSEQYGLDAYYNLVNSEYLEDPRAVWEQIRPHLTFGNLSQDWLVKNVLLQWYEQEGLISVLDEVQSSDISDRIKHDTSLLVLERAVKDTPFNAFEYAVRVQIERPSHDPLVFGVLGAWADFDPQSAMEHLDELTDPFLLRMGTRIVVARWATQDPDYVLENLEDFPPDQRQEATSIALRVLAVRNPTEAAKRALDEFKFSSHNPALRSVMGVWVQLDPTSAIDWVEQNGKNDWEKYALAAALTESLVSIESQRERAFDIARNVPDMDWGEVEYVGLEAEVIASIARWGGLETALKLLPEVRPGNTRAVATAGIAGVLIEENRTSEAFNLGLELPLDDQFKFFPEIANSWARADPDGLMGSIDDIADEKLRSLFALQVLVGYASNNFTDEQFETLQQYLNESDRAVFESQR